ncbi:MAG: hypothetical protein K6F47_11480 [Bacteroidaceae bacterium]|jgi:hypothetical protein|nr:hypothetical protein [Bacteroidaceae bacterium]
MILKIIFGWLVFDLIVYIVMWFEAIYYKKNLPAVFHKLLMAFTEED